MNENYIFELTLTVREPESFKFKAVNTVKSNDLIQLLSQFMLVIVTTAKEYYEKNGVSDDDIPF